MKTKKIINAVAYARSGTKNNKANSKIKWQLSKIEKFAQENWYVVLKKYVDKGFGGNAPDRPALHQLHKDAELGKWKVVLIHDLSRMARSSVIYKQIESNLQKNGVKIISIAGPNDLLLLDINSAFATHYSRSISERTKTGIVMRKQQK